MQAVDQLQTASGNAVAAGAVAAGVWQSFTAGASGLLTQVDFGRTPTNNGTINTTMNIYAGEGTAGTLLGSVPVTIDDNAPAAMQSVPFAPSLGINLTAGQQYSYAFPASAGFGLRAILSNPYAGGQFSLNASSDLQFRTFVTTGYIANPQSSIAAEVSVVGPLAATTLTGNGAGVTNVNAAMLNNAIGSATATPNTLVLRDANSAISGAKGQFSSAVTASSFVGDGSGLTNLQAGDIASGTLADVRLSTNVPLKNVANTFTSGIAASSFAGDGSGLTGLSAANIATGNLNDNRLSTNVPLKNANNAFTGSGVTSFVGPVGIGTTAPGTNAALEVNVASIGTGVNAWMIRFSNDTAAAQATPATGGLRQTNIGFLEMTNQLGTFSGVARLNNTGNWTASSDRRLKKDIEPAVGTLDAAMRLRPVTYAWIKGDDGSPRHLGLIAQEVREVLPDFVVGDEAQDTLTVNYSQMSVVAIGAVQELKAKCDALETENITIKQRLASLEAAMAALAAPKTGGAK